MINNLKEAYEKIDLHVRTIEEMYHIRKKKEEAVAVQEYGEAAVLRDQYDKLAETNLLTVKDLEEISCLIKTCLA